MSRSTVLMLLFCLIASTAHASTYSLTDYGVTSSEIYLNSSGQVGFSVNNSFVSDRGPWQFGYSYGNQNVLDIFNTKTGASGQILNTIGGSTPTGTVTGELAGLFSNSSGIIVGTVQVSDDPRLTQAWVSNTNLSSTNKSSFNAYDQLITIPSGFIQLKPSDINSAGLIVGQAILPNESTRAFLFNGQTTVDLNTLITPNSGLTLTSAVQIGDLGQIVGYAVDVSGNTHAVLLTPTAAPEPSSLLIALCSASTLAFVMRRKKSMGFRRSTTVE